MSRGRITVDGVDIRDLSFQALSDLVGVVSQETYLFDASVRENLRFAKPDATDAELEQAAQAARIHEVISQRFRMATTRSWGSAATASPAARSSAL